MYTFSGAAWAEETVAEPTSVGSAAARAKAKVEVASINNVLTLAFNLGAKTRSVNRENNVLFLPLPPSPSSSTATPTPPAQTPLARTGRAPAKNVTAFGKQIQLASLLVFSFSPLALGGVFFP